ncbi:Zn-dependent hydrolase [Phreatobacter stygius]|uniref:Zn-dependent hydrolase n=1 Tax=Phreatobacter stygius TaxID=1940610 RepID=A0A4D7BHW9_9HYPH|nr:Zn-dependent hydrolase [Phreatobacter stygius]QCI67452.1 Zn-dependent hydrolase [Phreatobacter stygius]
MPIDRDRLWRRIEALAGITDPDRPWTRRSFSPRFIEGRAWLAAEFRASGLATSIDAGGNLVGEWAGTDPALPPIVVGSHSDTVPAGGRFDGILGVIAGLEVAQGLAERGERLRHPLKVYDFLAEEPSEFGLSCIGSRAYAGKLTPDMLALKRADGVTLREAMLAVGGRPDELGSRAAAAPVAAYVELHIEQGRILESAGCDIGVVTDIVGIRRERITVTGRADHSGTTPMAYRADALVGAAAIIEAVHAKALALQAAARPVIGTIGHLVVVPNAANAVPGEVALSLEVRSADEDAIDRFGAELLETTRERTEALRLTVRRELVSHVAPTACAALIQQAAADAARLAGYSSQPIASGAGHDGVFVAATGPIGMIFIPCRDGRSHTPEEWTEPAQAEAGARVLAETVRLLDHRLAAPGPISPAL